MISLDEENSLNSQYIGENEIKSKEIYIISTPNIKFKIDIKNNIKLVTSLNKRFQNYFEKKIIIQYPIQISNIICKNVVSEDEIFQIEVDIKNISNFNYGKLGKYKRSINLKLLIDENFIFIKNKNNLIDIEIEEIQTNCKKSIILEVKSPIIIKSFSTKNFQVLLFFETKDLKKKILIEEKEYKFRLCEKFNYLKFGKILTKIFGLFQIHIWDFDKKKIFR
jgi:hypothetical protein